MKAVRIIQACAVAICLTMAAQGAVFAAGVRDMNGADAQGMTRAKQHAPKKQPVKQHAAKQKPGKKALKQGSRPAPVRGS